MSFPPRYRPRSEVAGEESRAKAVRSAISLFAVSGYEGTSIAKVATLAGLSQSGLLHHFPSKTALLAAVLEQRDAEDGEFLAAGEPPLGWAAFDALTALVARNSTRPQLVGLFVRLTAEGVDPDHPAHGWVRQHYANTTAWLTDAVRTGQRSGEIRPDAPVESLVRTTIAVMDGLQQQWLLKPDEVSMAADFATFVVGLRAQWEWSSASLG
jgi:AcrR family transcriptional regulator